MILLYAMIAVLLSSIGSKWIDYLYASPNAPLSFPDEIENRSKFRKPILAISIFLIANFVNIPKPTVYYAMIAIFFMLLITITDFEQYVIFDKMLLPFALIGLITIFNLKLPLINHFEAALIGGGIFFLIALLSKGALGGGDIKLISVLGLWFGLDKLSSIVIIGLILGGFSALIMLVTRLKNRQEYFAYGPYFTLSAIYILLK